MLPSPQNTTTPGHTHPTLKGLKPAYSCYISHWQCPCGYLSIQHPWSRASISHPPPGVGIGPYLRCGSRRVEFRDSKLCMSLLELPGSADCNRLWQSIASPCLACLDQVNRYMSTQCGSTGHCESTETESAE